MARSQSNHGFMQHLGIKERAVRFAGNWKDRQESMPDVYLREAQTLVLRAQERSLAYLQSGGDIIRLVGVPLDTAKTDEEESAEAGRKDRAMESAFCGVAASSVPPAFLDESFDLQGEFKGEKEPEPMKKEDLPDLDELVGLEENEEEQASSGAEEEKSEEKKLEDKDAQEILDEKDSEGMTTHWVQIKNPGPTAKLHLPPHHQGDLDTMVAAQPRCGLSGQFEFIAADEAMMGDLNVQLCRRCSPRSESRTGSCKALCGHVHLKFSNSKVARCFRVCVGGNAPHEEHRCEMHKQESEATSLATI